MIIEWIKRVVQTVKGKSSFLTEDGLSCTQSKKSFSAFSLSLYISFHSERRKYLWRFLFAWFFSLFVLLLFAWFWTFIRNGMLKPSYRGEHRVPRLVCLLLRGTEKCSENGRHKQEKLGRKGSKGANRKENDSESDFIGLPKPASFFLGWKMSVCFHWR